MPKKGTFSDDTFEKIGEFGKKTGKAVVKSVASTFNPLNIIDQMTGFNTKGSSSSIEGLEKGKTKKNNHTPLDFQKLDQSYDQQSKTEIKMMQQRLHQMVKGGDERLLLEHKQEEQQKAHQENMDRQQKNRREEQQRYQQGGELPQGKVRKSIFSHKKVAKREQTEVRPASGKQ